MTKLSASAKIIMTYGTPVQLQTAINSITPSYGKIVLTKRPTRLISMTAKTTINQSPVYRVIVLSRDRLWRVSVKISAVV